MRAEGIHGRGSRIVAVIAIAVCACGGDRRPAATPSDGGSGDAGIDGGADAGSDGGADTDGDCDGSGYPDGPYAWLLGEVVGDTTFPAIFDGAVTELVMAAAHCAQTKSLVFALGADT